MSRKADNYSEARRKEFASLSRVPYAEQAKRFMNVFWGDSGVGAFASSAEAREDVWRFHKQFVALDRDKREAGTELDEFQAHQFLEKEVKAITVKDLRAKLREIEIDDNNRMSLLEFLVFHHPAASWDRLLEWEPAASPRMMAKLKAAEAEMVSAQAALAAATETAAASKVAEATAAETAEQAASEARASVAAAAEAAAAKEELEAQERAKEDELKGLETKAADVTLSAMKQARAKAELSICRSEDSQPLRTARITAGATARKAAKAAKAAEAARVRAANDEVAAKDAAAAAAKALDAADDAVASLSVKIEQAKADAAGTGGSEGTIWWLDREFDEAKKYMGPKQLAKAEKAREAARLAAGDDA